jgi:type IV pilus assembly protein PilO
MASFSLTTLPWKTQLAIFLLLSLAAGGAFNYFHDMPTSAALDVRRAELSNFKGRIDKANETARQLPEFRKQVSDLQVKLDALRPILPDEKDAGELLRRMETLARESRLTILNFKPQPPTQKQMHAEWPIALELEGTYHNLGQFLDRVSKFPRIINVNGLTIKARENAGGGPTVSAQATATTFVLIDPAAGGRGRGAAPARGRGAGRG